MKQEPRGFCLRLKEWNDAMFWMTLEGTDGSIDAQLWISTFGLPQSRVDGRTDRPTDDWAVACNQFSLESYQEKPMNNAEKKNIPSLFFLLGLLVLGLFASLQLYPRTNVAAAPAVSPEMQRLQKFYLGTWEYTENYGKGAVNTGIYTSELGPGGNSMINHFHSQGPVGEFEGVLVITWDPKEKAYKNYVFGSDFPGALITTGNFEGDVLVFRGVVETPNVRMEIRSSASVDETGVMKVQEFVTKPGKPEALLVTVEAKRKP